MAPASHSPFSGKPLQCSIVGIGAWGPGFNNWQDLQSLLKGQESGVTEQPAGPRPEVIPANERRRAPLLVRLAVESSWQAMQQAGMESAAAGSVFASSFGDTDITAYMCRTLNTDAMQLSPTKFHNSVHNAAAGYWTISTHCMQSANSIAGFQHSTSLGLLDSASQCVSEQRPVLLSLFDAPVYGVLKKTLVNDFAFAASLVLIADAPPNTPRFEFSIDSDPARCTDHWPTPHNNNPVLHALCETNPVARILSILELLVIEYNDKQTVRMPLSAGTNLLVRRIS